MSDKDDAPDETSLIAEVDKKVKGAEATLQSFHRQWFVNIAMRRGLQYIQTHANAKAITTPPESDERVRMIINKMQGIHQTRVAKIIEDLPKLECVPGSSQEDDKDLARKGTKVLDWLWENEDVESKLEELAEWMVDCGTGFLMARWDPEKGPIIPTYQMHEGPVTGKEDYKVDEEGYILDKDLKRIEDEETIGDVAIDFIPSFDIINDGVSPTVEKSKWLVIQQGMFLSDIIDRWSERGERVKPEKDMSERAYYQRRLLSMVGNESQYFATDSECDEKMATVKTYLERKSKKYPKGRIIVVANGVLLQSGSMPYGNGSKFPIIKFGDIKVSGAFWDIGTMENLIPPQKGLNRTFSQLTENANNMGNVKLMAPKKHGMVKGAYDDSGNEVIEYKQGFKPEQLRPAEMPAYIQNQIDRYDKAFEDISGMHEVTNSSAPAGVTAAKAIIALQKQDDTRLAPTRKRFFKGLQKLGSICLELYGQYQEEERTYRIIGSKVDDLEEFSISKEEVQSLNKDVRIQTENILASQKSLQQENVRDYYSTGLFGDPADPKVRKRILQILEFGNISDFFEEQNSDTSQAKDENTQFLLKKDMITMTDPLSGKPIQTIEAFKFEDHDIHLYEHNVLRKSKRYRQMTKEDQRAVDIHCDIHEAFKATADNPPVPNDNAGAQDTAVPQDGTEVQPEPIEGEQPGMVPSFEPPMG